MEAWAEAYSMNKEVKTVRMVQNGIRPEGIETLIRDGLSKCVNLETMDLQDNTFTMPGASALSKAVVGWGNLIELGVGDCLLGARGGVVLAEALQSGKNKSLKRLKLQYNEIDAKGAKQFKVAVADGLPTLEKIELNGNKFSEDDEVVEALREIFDERGVGEMDSLSDMEEESDEEEEEEDEEDEEREKLVKDGKRAEEENVAPEKDKEVDDLADLLSKKANV